MLCKICIKCKEEKDIILFNNRKYKNTIKKNNVCKTCQAISSRKHYLSNKDKIIKRSADRRNKSNISTKNRLFVLECLSAGCVDCGEKDILTLDFDHIKDKCSEISTLISRCVSFKKLKDEISKCEVRCANCHRRKTYQQINCWRFKYV